MAPWDRERVTLVMESEAVRLMGVMRGSVTRWGSAPLARGTIVDGAVADGVALAQVVERLWAAQTQGASVPRDNIILAIPGRHVASRMEPVIGSALPDSSEMALKARQALPWPDAYHAWQLVGPTSQQRLFVLAAPADLVNGYVSALAKAGLGIASVDVKPLALIRAVGHRHAIILDGERSFGTVIVVDEALPRQVHFWPLESPLLATPEDKVMRLAEALHTVIRQSNNQGGGQPLHPAVPVFLTGSIADHPLLRDVVRDAIGHPVGVLSPGIQTPVDMPVSQFLANVGLALKKVEV